MLKKTHTKSNFGLCIRSIYCITSQAAGLCKLEFWKYTCMGPGHDLHSKWQSPGECCRTERFGAWFPTSQVENVAKDAFGTSAFVRKGIECKGWDIMMQLHKPSVRSTRGVMQFLVTQLWKDVIE